MILADTSIWIEYLHGRKPEMRSYLATGQIAMHPMIAAELAMGSLRDRQKTLLELDQLVQVRVAQTPEVRSMIEAHALFGRGIGLVDAHLLASCFLTPGTQLWTRDKALGSIAAEFGVVANLA